MNKKTTETRTTESLWDYSISFIVKISGFTESYHNCYKVIVSLDRPFDCLIDGKTHSHLQGIIINQKVPVSFYAQDTTSLVNFIEADSLGGMQLGSLLDGVPFLNLDDIIPSKKISSILPSQHTKMSDQDLIHHVSKFLNLLFGLRKPVTGAVTDGRIRLVLQYINDNLHNPLTLDNISELINLSPDHLRHLFVTQMHIPFSQYLLWRRIRKVMAAAIGKESNINDACSRFGFTDQSHFNRTFKRIFGITPYALINHARFLYG